MQGAIPIVSLKNDDVLCSCNAPLRNLDKDLCTKMFVTALFIIGEKGKKATKLTKEIPQAGSQAAVTITFCRFFNDFGTGLG